MKITYYGHSCLLAEEGGKSVIVDPFLSGNPNSGAEPKDVKVDAVILTHGHDDHFGDTLEIAKNNDCPVIAVFELAVFCQRKGVKAHPMNTGGSYAFDGFSVQFTPAFHSSSVTDGDHTVYAGQPCGIVLTMGGKKLYHAGDTALFSDIQLIGERHSIDIAALPIGDNLTMGPEDAALAAKWCRTSKVIPVHYNTFPAIEQDPSVFAKQLSAYDIACSPLKAGESLQI